MRTPRLLRRHLIAAALALIVIGGSAPVAKADGRRPDAQVDVSRWAREGAWGSILLTVKARCRPGNIVQDLVITYTQNGFSHEQPAAVSVTCDGRWHRLAVTGPEAFEPGPADITARLTVVDEVTGDPVPQALDSQRVWVKSAASVLINSRAKLAHDGSAAVVAKVRCSPPWIVQELVVELSQGGAGGSAFRTDDFVACDDRWHRVVLRVSPGDVAFTAGDAQALAFFTVLDPVSFDPVTQAQANTTVRLLNHG